jgi:hypothetical protein
MRVSQAAAAIHASLTEPALRERAFGLQTICKEINFRSI